MKVAIAQLNPVVGDVCGNLAKLKQVLDELPAGSADLLVTPELYLCGYPPRDLMNAGWFLAQIKGALEEIRAFSAQRPDVGLLVGAPYRNGRTSGKNLYNSALLYEKGELRFVQHKQLLPTYDVFDEDRYFDEGVGRGVVEFRGKRLGISICEDGWNDPDFEKTHEYDINPIEMLAREGVDLMINLSASPYHRGKEKERFARFAFHAKKWNVPFVFAGQAGANDELVFDGMSFVVTPEGKTLAQLPTFEEAVRVVDLDAAEPREFETVEEIEMVRRALVRGVQDYMGKSGFKRAVIGLSGGIDSAVVAAIAVDALGAENVRGITMPSHFSTSGSVDDSLELAKNLGIQCDRVSIKGLFDTYTSALAPSFNGLKRDVTEENLQARIRGTLLMAYSNKFNAILLTTGNKSELAVGYCTLYGDMNGGLAVISDVPKTTVYELSNWYNKDKTVIPQAIIDKAPSAELAPDQKDQDSLPEYDVLDDILHRYLEEGESTDEIVLAGHSRETAEWVVGTVDRNEYKRKQAAPGLRVTSKAFGTGRRMPIVGRWEH